jgi:hypothetical protein
MTRAQDSRSASRLDQQATRRPGGDFGNGIRGKLSKNGLDRGSVLFEVGPPPSPHHPRDDSEVRGLRPGPSLVLESNWSGENPISGQTTCAVTCAVPQLISFQSEIYRWRQAPRRLRSPGANVTFLQGKSGQMRGKILFAPLWACPGRLGLATRAQDSRPYRRSCDVGKGITATVFGSGITAKKVPLK